MMKEPTVSELKDAKVKLEKEINNLLVQFRSTNGVVVSGLSLNTYSTTPISGGFPERYSDVKVEIIL